MLTLMQDGPKPLPSEELAKRIAQAVVGASPSAARRFTTGTSNYVFEVTFLDKTPVVVRITSAANRTTVEDAVYLNDELRRHGVRLPKFLAYDASADAPWIVMDRLEGTDLEHVIDRLMPVQLKTIANDVTSAQAKVAHLGRADRYGYAVKAADAPDARWSEMIHAYIARSKARMVAAGLFDSSIANRVETAMIDCRHMLDQIAPTPFLHDTTTKNVIVTPQGELSGIVDVDDLCFGDARYPIALTMAALDCYHQSTAYARYWLRAAEYPDDDLFRFYVAVHILCLMSDHGQQFNGNVIRSEASTRARLVAKLDAWLPKYA